MFKIARERPGMYSIQVNQAKYAISDRCFCCCEPDEVPRKIVVNITGEEFAKLDKVIMNQTYAESKAKVQSAIVFQHAAVIWPSHTPDDVTMRTLGAWAITQYRCDGSWTKYVISCFPCIRWMQKRTRLNLKQDSGATVASVGVIIYSPDKKILCGVEPPGKPRAGMLTLPCGKKDPGETDEDCGQRETREEVSIRVAKASLREYKSFTFLKFNCKLFAVPNIEVADCPENHSDKLLQLNYRSAEEVKHQFADVCIAQCLKTCIQDGVYDDKIFKLPTPQKSTDVPKSAGTTSMSKVVEGRYEEYQRAKSNGEMSLTMQSRWNEYLKAKETQEERDAVPRTVSAVSGSATYDAADDGSSKLPTPAAAPTILGPSCAAAATPEKIVKSVKLESVYSDGPPRNELGFVQPGHGSEDLHPLGGASADDAQIRAEREDRVIQNEAGVGVVGQSANPNNPKQIVGGLSLPLTEPPNVYAKEGDNAEIAIDARLTKKQRPFTANKEDKALLNRMVQEAIGNDPRRSLFSARRIARWWENNIFSNLRSGKWTE